MLPQPTPFSKPEAAVLDDTEKAFREVLKQRLQKLLDEDLTNKSLSAIENTARLSRELLNVQGKSESFVENFASTYGGLSIAGSGGLNGGLETFGATLIREVMPILVERLKPKKPAPKIADLQIALGIARSREDKTRIQQIENTILAIAEGDTNVEDVVESAVVEQQIIEQPEQKPCPGDCDFFEGHTGACKRVPF